MSQLQVRDSYWLSELLVHAQRSDPYERRTPDNEKIEAALARTEPLMHDPLGPMHGKLIGIEHCVMRWGRIEDETFHLTGIYQHPISYACRRYGISRATGRLVFLENLPMGWSP